MHTLYPRPSLHTHSHNSSYSEKRRWGKDWMPSLAKTPNCLQWPGVDVCVLPHLKEATGVCMCRVRVQEGKQLVECHVSLPFCCLILLSDLQQPPSHSPDASWGKKMECSVCGLWFFCLLHTLLGSILQSPATTGLLCTAQCCMSKNRFVPYLLRCFQLGNPVNGVC